MREGITIIAINRGWLVNLPLMMRPSPIISDDLLRHQANVIKEELVMADLILARVNKIMGELSSGEGKGPSEGILVEASDLSDKSIFYFNTFPEVLTFLKSVVSDFEE